MTKTVTSGAAYAAAVATEKEVIDLGELSLIGLFGTETARRALVRHASGRTQMVEMGERVRGAKVVAISQDALFLSAGSGTRKLEMPAG